MKTGVKLTALALILVISIAMKLNSLATPDAAVTLEEAIKTGLISGTYKGAGGHSGNCMTVVLKNLKDKKLSIAIPAGSMFKPSDDEAQNILVPQEQLFVVNPGETKTVKVRGFCCESHDHSPAKDMAFSLSSNKDPKMQKLFAFVKGKTYSDEIMQEAVWCISNNHNVSDVYSPNMGAIKPLRDELCKITGQKDTWYSTPKTHAVDAQGNISHETTQVTGMIKFKAEKKGKIHNEIYDAENNMLVKNPNEFDVIVGFIEYEFTIRVGGWQKGTYYVKVFENEKVIHTQEFKI